MAFEIGDKKRLMFVVAVVVMLALAGYVWYPRLLGKKPPLRARQPEPPPLLIVEQPKPPAAPTPAARAKPPAAEPAKVAAQRASPEPVRTTTRPPAPETVKQTAKAPAAAMGAAKDAPEPTGPAARGQRYYGLEFPPFVTVAEAEEHERKLKEAGLPTLRTTTDLKGGLYTLVVGPLPSAAKATEVMAELRAKATGSPTAGEGGFLVGDGPYVLREVVPRAIEVRGKGYAVKIVPAEGKASLYVIRTAATLDNAQASKLSSHYRERGFPNSVVSAR